MTCDKACLVNLRKGCLEVRIIFAACVHLLRYTSVCALASVWQTQINICFTCLIFSGFETPFLCGKEKKYE